jgi:hypothetical protein
MRVLESDGVPVCFLSQFAGICCVNIIIKCRVIICCVSLLFSEVLKVAQINPKSLCSVVQVVAVGECCSGAVEKVSLTECLPCECHFEGSKKGRFIKSI